MHKVTLRALRGEDEVTVASLPFFPIPVKNLSITLDCVNGDIEHLFIPDGTVNNRHPVMSCEISKFFGNDDVLSVWVGLTFDPIRKTIKINKTYGVRHRVANGLITGPTVLDLKDILTLTVEV